MADPTLFDAPTGDTLRDEALARVELNADARWFHRATRFIRWLKAGVEFTADDVWYSLGDEETTHEPRALGAVIRAAAKANLIRKTGAYRPSTRPACHSRPVAVWVRL